jgi:transposase
MRFVKTLAPETVSLLWRVYKQSRHYRVRQRAHCILLSGQGHTVPQLAQMFNVSQQTVYHWLNAWETRHLSGLYDRPGKGCPPKLTEQQHAQVKEWVKQFPKNLRAVIALVKEHFQVTISRQTVKRIAQSLEMSWRRILRRPKKKPDPTEYQRKANELETFKTQADEGEIDLVYCDEAGFCLNSEVPSAWQEKGHSIEIPTGKSPRMNILGFLSRQQHLQAWMFEASMNSDVVIACIDAFCQTVTKRTILVIDNASIHTSDAVEEKRAEWQAHGVEFFF